jgi:hypothetical protein
MLAALNGIANNHARSISGENVRFPRPKKARGRGLLLHDHCLQRREQRQNITLLSRRNF